MTDLDDFIDFWNLYTKGREYGFKSTDYAGGVHRGQDVPGLVKEHPWIGKSIPLLRPGRLVSQTRQTKLGGVFVYDVGGGEYDGYSHTHPLDGGMRLSTWADSADWQGTSWGGPHLHLVRSRFVDASWNTDCPTLDPRPVIRAQLRGARAERAALHQPPTPAPLEVDMLPIIYLKASGGPSIFALNTATGKKRKLTSAEWKAVQAGAAAAGFKLPFADGVLNVTQIKSIPE